jgi:oxygen-dependent protoporphyrinogen oxidase
VPEVDALVRGSRSVSLAARRRAKAAPPAAGPALVSLAGGLSRLVDALAGALGDADLRLGTTVEGLHAEGDRFRLRLAEGAPLEADLVVLATPAYVTAQLLGEVAPDAAAAAAEVPYADVASLTLAYPREALTRDLDGTGFLVPPVEGLLLVGCSWLPAKWPQLADPETVLIRGMVGRYGDRRFAGMDDDELVAAVHRELVLTMGLAAPPTEGHVQRWPRAMPQYTVGHQARLDRIDRALAEHPGLRVTGAGYRGVGLASCVSQAERTVHDLVPRLTAAAPLSGGPA